jgi:hypothetical protein
VAKLGNTLNLPDDMQDRLVKELSAMKHRTYLWLYLAIDEIEESLKDSLRPDREGIPLLPKNVPEAYDRILARVTHSREHEVEMILRIIVGARRPLTIQEMAMALGVATTSDAQTTREADLDPSGLDIRIRRLCGLFVFIKNNKVYLIHQTAREFLISKVDKSPELKWYLEPTETELLMARICGG